MNLKNIGLCFAMAVASILSTYAAGPTFELVPLFGMKINYEGLKYADIRLKTEDGSAIANNNVPQNFKFSVNVEKPTGFLDSNGFSRYGLELTITTADGNKISSNKDVFSGLGVFKNTENPAISYNLGFDASTKANTKVVITARLFDRAGKGYISMTYNLTVVAASKRLQKTIQSYNSKDSKGMKTSSVGLHFNYFEFKGLAGNNFIYRINKTDVINFTLKGLDGWKINEGFANPIGEIAIFDEKGNEQETDNGFLEKTSGESISKDKKELEIKYKPTSALENGKSYFVWLKLKDKNSARGSLDLIVKIYIEK